MLSLATGISFEEFLETDFQQAVEWVDGEVFALTPVQLTHARLCAFLLAAIRTYVEAKEAGEVLSEPFIMKTGPNLPGRSPDLMFVSRDRLGSLKKRALEGPADLVIEVLSPESRGRDRGDKFYEYEQGGVREYWLIDPYRNQVEVYFLEEDRFQLQPFEGETIVRSRLLPGLWFKIDDFWGPPFPTVLQLLSRWQVLGV